MCDVDRLTRALILLYKRAPSTLVRCSQLQAYILEMLSSSGRYQNFSIQRESYLIERFRSWPGENVSAQTKRAVAVAMQITIGDIGAIAG